MKEIELSKNSKKYKGMYKAIVDDDVFEEVNKYSWYYQNGYASRSERSIGKQKTIYLHVYIWELKMGSIPEGLEVDHKDKNKLNCQLSNLRLATHAENNRNKNKRNDNTSGYIGVSKDAHKTERQDGIHIYEYWRARWQDSKGKERQKGFPYDNVGKVRAARYYDLMAKQFAGDYMGELNFSSLEEYQHALKRAILEDIESN